ncbi:MAG: FAD-dependent oxidoreductase [Candidatus Methylacidiphilales bacterium]
MTKSSMASVPVFRDVDVCIVGSTSAAVAAALAVRRAGRTVMVAADHSYLGNDLAGKLKLWPGAWRMEDAILKRAYGVDAPFPARPASIKRVMEEALLSASIPFMYLCRPVSLLRGEDGELAGAVLAMRTSLMAVTCRTILDASDFGVVAKLAGLPLAPRELPARVSWTVLGRKAPADWPGEVEEIEQSFTQRLKDGTEETWPAFKLTIDRDKLGSDPRAMEHVARGLLVDENVLVTADLLDDAPEVVLATSGGAADLKNSIAQVTDAELQPAPNIWLLNGLLPLSAEGLSDLRNPVEMMSLARRAGAAAAASVSASARTKATRFTNWTESPSEAAAGTFAFAPILARPGDMGSIEIPNLQPSSLGSYDVVVAGGGTGGAPAGIGAAREGARTLVLEAQHGLGGVGTLGLISSYWFGNKVGFTHELNEAVSAADALSKQKSGNTWHPGVKSAIYHRMLQAAGGSAWSGSWVFGVRMEGTKVTGVLISTPYGCGLVDAGTVIDATGNADIAAAAGAPCRVIDARHVAVQGTGLSPLHRPGSHYQNSDHTFVDEGDPFGITSAFVQARAKYSHSFDTAGLVNSRERRQIHGEIEISPLDLLAGRVFPDTLFTARSNFDTHGFTIHPVFMVTAPDHKALQANVPFRCMLPRGVEGVVVTGLGMSAHRDALPVVRMQADVQNQGYAAGLAAATASAKKQAVRDIDLPQLQQRLVEIGILSPEAFGADTFPMSTEAVRQATEADWSKLDNVAVLFAHEEQSRGPLLEILRDVSADPKRRSDAALMLGLMGEKEAAPVLAESIRGTAGAADAVANVIAKPSEEDSGVVKAPKSSGWDAGWNYKGMGQFGESMSRLDAEIVALARTGDPLGVEVIEEKILALDSSAEFSHCRVASLAATLLPHPRLAAALTSLLQKPGVQGHTWHEVEDVRKEANDNQTENIPRNLALRELHLARGLYLAGDPDGLGRRILESYAGDLRGHFARHAQSLLACEDMEALRAEVA